MAYICTTITLRNMQKEICNMFPCAQLLHHDTMICDHPMITINRSAWCTSTVSLYHTSLVSTYKYYIVNVCVNFKKYIYKWTVSFIWVFFYTERSFIYYSSHAWDLNRLGFRSFGQKLEARIWNEDLAIFVWKPNSKFQLFCLWSKLDEIFRAYFPSHLRTFGIR